MFEFLGEFFDFDGSEMIEADEAAIGFAMLEDMMNEDHDSDENWMDRETDLYIAGLDADDLRWMDEDERFSALENAGLDPFDFDYFNN